jgi:hypothetical protein
VSEARSTTQVIRLRRQLPLLAAATFWLLSVLAVPASASLESWPEGQEAIGWEAARSEPTVAPVGGTPSYIGVERQLAAPKPPAGLLGPPGAAGGVNLSGHEAAGGHLIARHIGQSEAQLAARLSAQPGIRAASTFTSVAEAEAGVTTVLGARAGQVSSWVASGAQGRLVLEAPFAGGQVLARGATTSASGSAIRLVLEGTGGGTWRIITGYPLP